jgi:hypothetical protein
MSKIMFHKSNVLLYQMHVVSSVKKSAIKFFQMLPIAFKFTLKGMSTLLCEALSWRTVISIIPAVNV